MFSNIDANIRYAVIGTGLMTAVNYGRGKPIYPIETFLFGSLGVFSCQVASYSFAQYKAKFMGVTPDTYVNDYLAKSPMAEIIRVAGLIAGFAICEFSMKNE